MAANNVKRHIGHHTTEGSISPEAIQLLEGNQILQTLINEDKTALPVATQIRGLATAITELLAHPSNYPRFRFGSSTDHRTAVLGPTLGILVQLAEDRLTIEQAVASCAKEAAGLTADALSEKIFKAIVATATWDYPSGDFHHEGTRKHLEKIFLPPNKWNFANLPAGKDIIAKALSSVLSVIGDDARRTEAFEALWAEKDRLDFTRFAQRDEEGEFRKGLQKLKPQLEAALAAIEAYEQGVGEERTNAIAPQNVRKSVGSARRST